MKKLLKTIFIFLLFFIISSCVFDRIDKRRLMIYNNSNKEIYNVISPNDSIYRLEIYDDFV